MTAHNRQTVLDLVQWNGPINGLIAAARRIPERVTPVVILDRTTAEAVLRKLLSGEAPLTDLTAWAEELHTREDVDIEPDHEDLLTQFLFEFSTSELFEPITRELCNRWIDELRKNA
ncbi:hypothetical protein [Streptomyces sp. bgisy126]|uniref:hypothetical protein n=1 Tax=unclassified Streptomyces TaxID=2593676 RepID=UPI003EBBB34C